MKTDWALLQRRIQTNEHKAPSELRLAFSRWLYAQSDIRPMTDHQQTSKMAFLTGAFGKVLLWDLSVRGTLVFWTARSHDEQPKLGDRADKIKPWDGNGRGRHSHLNNLRSFAGQDACRYSCKDLVEAQDVFRSIQIIRERTK